MEQVIEHLDEAHDAANSIEDPPTTQDTSAMVQQGIELAQFELSLAERLRQVKEAIASNKVKIEQAHGDEREPLLDHQDELRDEEEGLIADRDRVRRLISDAHEEGQRIVSGLYRRTLF